MTADRSRAVRRGGAESVRRISWPFPRQSAVRVRPGRDTVSARRRGAARGGPGSAGASGAGRRNVPERSGGADQFRLVASAPPGNRRDVHEHRFRPDLYRRIASSRIDFRRCAIARKTSRRSSAGWTMSAGTSTALAEFHQCGAGRDRRAPLARQPRRAARRHRSRAAHKRPTQSCRSSRCCRRFNSIGR